MEPVLGETEIIPEEVPAVTKVDEPAAVEIPPIVPLGGADVAPVEVPPPVDPPSAAPAAASSGASTK